MDDGTQRALKPIAEQVLAWVAHERKLNDQADYEIRVDKEDLRRIELCAQATLDVAMFNVMYPPPSPLAKDWPGYEC